MNNMKNLYQMQMQEEQANPEETRSPYINQLIQLIAEIKEGTKGEEDLVEAVTALTEMFNNLKAIAEYLKQTQPPSDNFDKNYLRLMELLNLLQDELPALGLYFEENNPECFDEPIEKIKTYIAEVFEITDELKKVEESQPVYSGSVYLNELIRVGKGYCSGAFAFDVFKDRYTAAYDVIEETSAQMTEISQQPFDTKALEESMPEILKNMESMVNASHTIGEFIEGGDSADKSIVEKALDDIEKASARIGELQEKINEEVAKLEEERSKRLCPRCGCKTSVYETHCEGCKMLLPPIELPEQQRLDLVAGEAGVSGQGLSDGSGEERIITPNVAKMYDAALAVGNNEIPKEEFGKMIEWYGALVDQARLDMEKIVEPEGLTDEEKTIFDEAFRLFKEGVTGSEAGLTELLVYFTDESTDHLVDGINMLIEAGEKMYQLDVMGNIIQGNTKKEAEGDSSGEAEEPADPSVG